MSTGDFLGGFFYLYVVVFVFIAGFLLGVMRNHRKINALELKNNELTLDMEIHGEHCRAEILRLENLLAKSLATNDSLADELDRKSHMLNAYIKTSK